jgi:hypothetical protein
MQLTTMIVLSEAGYRKWKRLMYFNPGRKNVLRNGERCALTLS